MKSPCPYPGNCARCDKGERDALILRNVILPTAAMLEGEEAAREGRGAWCCPLCGGLNNAAATPGRESSAAGWCQHDRCVTRRDVCRSLPPWESSPEITFAIQRHAFRAPVYA